MTTLAEALTTGTGIERQFNCPVHGDSHPSASVNVVKGKWYCYRCHAHGSVSGDVFDDVDPVLLMDDLLNRLAEPDREFYPESWLDSFDAAGPGGYWLERFEPATASHFRLGTDVVKDAATYPLRDGSGRVLGVVRRPLAETRSKYRYPRGVRTASLLFNYSPVQVRTVVLTEGATDTMAAWESGLTPDLADALAVACFSNRLSRAQCALLDRIDPERVVIAFDNDTGGMDGTAIVRSLLSSRQLFQPNLGRYKDLAEMPPSLRRQCLDQAVAL